jgi:hypothetical protein
MLCFELLLLILLVVFPADAAGIKKWEIHWNTTNSM